MSKDVPPDSLVTEAFPGTRELNYVDRARDFLLLTWFRLTRRHLETHSSGSIAVPRYGGLVVNERVELPPIIDVRHDTKTVVSRFAELGAKNPCETCPTMISMISNLAMKSGVEPEEMKEVYVNCRPDQKNSPFYEVEGTALGMRSRMRNVSCTLLHWLSKYRLE